MPARKHQNTTIRSEVRKIVKVGDSSYLSLPPGFVKEHGLKPGDSVPVAYNGVLIVTPISEAKEEPAEKVELEYTEIVEPGERILIPVSGDPVRAFLDGYDPFYEQITLEIPDNWSDDLYYNVPLQDMMDVIDYALENGYSICWDGDVSDKGFSHKNGIAIIPEKKVESLDGTERERWEKLTASEKAKELYDFEKPGDEKEISQQMRQEHFDNYTSTDDHLMHLSGIVKDQHETKYYITKNSWDDDSNDNGGYLNMSESFVKLNTIAIMVNKEALPRELAKKLGL